MKKYSLIIFLMLIYGGLNRGLAQALEPQSSDSEIQITELLPNPASPQTDANDEYVELYNPSSVTVDLEGYVIKTGSTDNHKYTIKGFSIEPDSYKVFYSHDTPLSLSNSGGHAKLFSPDGSQINVTDDYSNAPDGQAWARINDKWQWTNTPTPGEANIANQDDQGDGNPPPGGPYATIDITELLPNPASPQTDNADEFVELYNSNNQDVDLNGYTLVAGLKDSYKFTIKSTVIGSGAYLAFYSRDTSLTLSNSGGHVKLLAPDGSLVSSTADYGSAKDGQAWAYDNGQWQWTNTPSPGSANVLTEPAVLAATSSEASPKRTSTVKKSSASASKAKKASSSSSSSKKSKTKNPLLSASNSDPPTTTGSSNLHIGLLAGIGGAALIYALYEYRHDLANRFYQLRRYRETRRASRQAVEVADSNRVTLRFGRWQNNLRAWFSSRTWL